MKIECARKALDDTSFLKGSNIRAAALKELAEMEDPLAAEALVSAVDENSPSATKAQEILEADRKPGWGDKLWMIWAQKRQPWLRKTLQTRGTTFSRPDCRVGILSRLVLGGQWKADAGTAKLVSAFVNDADLYVQGAARQYFDGLQKHVPKLWMETLLRAKLFARISGGRKAAEVLSLFLYSDMCTLACSAAECLATWPVADRVLVLLLAGKESELPLDQETAFAVAEYNHDARDIVAMGAMVYLDRVMASGADFIVALAFKSGRPAKLAVTPATIMEALGLLRAESVEIATAAYKWLSVLPRDKQVNDLMVDDWFRTEDPHVGKLLRFGKRFPSDAGREVLLRLLWGDIKGYLEMDDADCALLAKVLTDASAIHRTTIVATIQSSGNDEMADRFKRASLVVQGNGSSDAFFTCDRK
jgi:hypothetical protein